VFAADAEAQEPWGHVCLSWEFAAPFYGGFDAAQAGGVDDDVEGIAEAVSGGGVGYFEGQHGAEAGHLRSGGAVPGMAGEAGVARAADGRVLIEPAGEFAGVGLAAVQPQGKGAQAAQCQKGLQGAGGCAGEAAAVAQARSEGLLAGDGDAGQQVGVAADEFGGARRPFRTGCSGSTACPATATAPGPAARRSKVLIRP